MKEYRKKSYPVNDARFYLEPSPAVLLTSQYKNERNIMTLGWYTIMEFTPSLIGCMISSSNHSFELIKKSRVCVINLLTFELSHTVEIGNCSGIDTNKFDKFALKTEKGHEVNAPLLVNCYASFECRLYDSRLVKDYNFFIFEIVKAHVASSPKYPKTIQYRGNNHFIDSGKNFMLTSFK